MAKWIDIATHGRVRRGIEYTFVFYGGSNQAHVSFTSEFIQKLVHAFRLCHVNIFVADSNKEKISDVSQSGASEIETQLLPPNLCWITQGREIENYLAPDLIEKHFGLSNVETEYSDLYECERTQRNGKSQKKKVDLVRKLLEDIEDRHLDVLDLRMQLVRVIEAISIANGLKV